MTKNQKIFIISIILFVALNVLITYLVTTNIISDYLVTLERTFLGEFNALLGNSAIVGIFLLIGLLSAKKQKNQLFLLMMLSFLLGFAVVMFGTFVKFYNVAFDFMGLDVFRNPITGFSGDIIVQGVVELFTELRILAFVPFVALLVLYILYDKKNSPVRTTPILVTMKRATLSLLFLLMALLTNVSIYTWIISDQWDSNIARSTFVAQNMGLYPHFVYQLTGQNFRINFQHKYGYDETSAFVEQFNRNVGEYVNPITNEIFSNRLTIDQLHPNIQIDPSLVGDNGSLHGILAGRNLVLVHLESVVRYAVDLFPQMWPFLQQLLQESLVFTSFHHTVGIGTTADAEFTALTGLYSTGYSTLYWDFDRNPFWVESLPNLFHTQGVYALAVQADDPTFYNRNVIYSDSLLNFNSFFCLEDFHNDPDPYVRDANILYNHANPWITDFGMTRMIRNTLKTSTQPHFIFTKTMMPHTPFGHNPPRFESIARDYFTTNYEWFSRLSTMGRRYLEFIPYMDEVIRSFFFNILTGENQTPANTVFLFYGDHAPQLADSDVRIMHDNPNMSRMETFVASMTTKTWLYVPGLEINENGINRGLITGNQPLVRSQLDIFRTVVELFDLTTDIPYFGTHLLSTELTFSITTRFFAVATNTFNPTTKAIGYAAFLMIDKPVNLGDMDLLTDSFITLVNHKMVMMRNWISSSGLTNLDGFD